MSAIVDTQRFRNDLGLFCHIHALVTDGCFEQLAGYDDAVQFWPTEELSSSHLGYVLEVLHDDLAEHVGDEPELLDDATMACLQLCLPAPTLRAVDTTPHSLR